MAISTRHNADASRYEIFDDDALVGIADYVLTGSTAVFPHTEIVPARRGEGLGEILVRAALDDQRRTGNTVVASCWFVADFIDANPEYADLTHV
jgi:predicted GNAT family acetyltransferase